MKKTGETTIPWNIVNSNGCIAVAENAVGVWYLKVDMTLCAVIP